MRLPVAMLVVSASASWLSPPPPSIPDPPRVGSMELDELVRYADAIVLARITRIEEVPRQRADGPAISGTETYYEHERLDATIGIAEIEVLGIAELEVQRTIKGDEAARALYSAPNPPGRAT